MPPNVFLTRIPGPKGKGARLYHRGNFFALNRKRDNGVPSMERVRDLWDPGFASCQNLHDVDKPLLVEDESASVRRVFPPSQKKRGIVLLAGTGIRDR